MGTQGEGSVLATKGGGGTQAKCTVRATRRTMDNTGQRQCPYSEYRTIFISRQPIATGSTAEQKAAREGSR